MCKITGNIGLENTSFKQIIANKKAKDKSSGSK